MSLVSYLLVSCCLVGHLLPLIQGQTFTNTLPPNCNPPPPLPNLLLPQPFYTKFLVANEPDNEIDNECYTACPLEGGDSSHYLLYESRVYTNGTNEVYTYLQHFNSSGVIFLDSPQCRALDTIFDQASDGTYIAQRCYLGGETHDKDCPVSTWSGSFSRPVQTNNIRTVIYIAYCDHFNTSPCFVPVFGISSTYGRLDSQYYDEIFSILDRRSYPYQRYVSMPMNFPPQCVTCPNCALP